MLSDAYAYPVSSALPVVAVIAVSGILTLAISAWLIRELARNALEKAAQADVPQVLIALGSLVDRLRLFLPWQGHGRATLPSNTVGSATVAHTEATKASAEGGPQ